MLSVDYPNSIDINNMLPMSNYTIQHFVFWHANHRFAGPKGGVGKSTTAVLLATEVAGFRATVTMIDADPNKPLSHWANCHKNPLSSL